MKKNILIIDDSALMRRVISDIIESDSRFQVSDTAKNGLEGYELVTRNLKKYDAIILDINMPKMNGIEFLEHIGKLKIEVKVVVVSTVAKEGAKETIRALELGAFDFVTKPTSLFEAKEDIFRKKIINCLLCATEKKPLISTDRLGNATSSPARKILDTKQKMNKNRHKGRREKGKKLVALACSTGGPKALQTLIPKLPPKLDAPVLIVQHMPEGFTKSLAARLDEMSAIKVKEAEEGEVLQKGIVYIAKGGKQMRVVQGQGDDYKVAITSEAARNGLKPCADIMYESLISSSYEEITCVVLTGMGGDGTQGIKQLNEKNDIYSIAQDAATSIVYGMPKVFYESGLVDEILPLEEIADAIAKHVGVQ